MVSPLTAKALRLHPDGYFGNAREGDAAYLAEILATYGRYTIGDPKPTPKRNAAELAERGIVGVYLVLE